MKVYQCDRCKAIFEPRILDNGEPYISRKKVEILTFALFVMQVFSFGYGRKARQKNEKITSTYMGYSKSSNKSEIRWLFSLL